MRLPPNGRLFVCASRTCQRGDRFLTLQHLQHCSNGGAGGGGGGGLTVKRLLWVTLILALNISTAKAVTCEEFVARVVEGAAYYKVPVPKFDLEWVNSADADWRYFKITAFGDVRAIMGCRHGWVDTFAVDANNSEGMSTVHVSALTAIGL